MGKKAIIGAAAVAAVAGVAMTRKLRSGEVVYHVAATDSGWEVKAEGAERAASAHDTKRKAVSAARELAARKAPSRLVIHRQDGSVQTEHAYGGS